MAPQPVVHATESIGWLGAPIRSQMTSLMVGMVSYLSYGQPVLLGCSLVMRGAGELGLLENFPEIGSGGA